jgi:hypothetical protein
MKERPILFSAAMVAAIVSGTKTQTRRKVEHGFTDKKMNERDIKAYVSDGGAMVHFKRDGGAIFFCGIPNSHGEIGDLLYVREAWRLIGWDFEDGTMLIEYKDGKRLWMDTHDPTEDSQWLVDQVEKLWLKGCLGEDPEDPDKAVIIKTVPWRPSIHMPKAAARLWLLLEGIGAERLQDISEEDAIAEGIEKYGPFGEYKGAIHPNGGSMKFRAYERASRAFQDLWEGINGEDSWKINPWVWTLKFKELSKEGRPNV